MSICTNSKLLWKLIYLNPVITTNHNKEDEWLDHTDNNVLWGLSIFF